MKKFLFLGILAMVLVLIMPTGQTQQINAANTQSAINVASLTFA